MAHFKPFTLMTLMKITKGKLLNLHKKMLILEENVDVT